jgi:hypothetical protein
MPYRTPRLEAGSSPRRLLSRAALCALLLACSARQTHAQEGRTAKDDDRELRLSEMRLLAESLVASRDEGSRVTPLRLRGEPLHRWNDPTRSFSDGSFWAWGEPGRPAAIVAIELYPPSAGTSNAAWSFEFVSLSTGTLQVKGGEGFDAVTTTTGLATSDGGIYWKPSQAGIAFQAIPTAPAPGRSAAVRMAQIKDLAKRFSSHEFYKPANSTAQQRIELRLMPRPIDRYSDPALGLWDGAILLFANGTNPEVMLLIEAHGTALAQASWHFAAARLSRAACVLNLDQREVWSVPYITHPASDATYVNARKLRK